MKKIPRKYLTIGIVALVLIAVGVVLALWAGTAELDQFNNHSIMDWSLGKRIEGIDSPEDAKAFDPAHFEWFEDSFGSGLRNVSTNAQYYLDNFPDTDVGAYCLTGFSSNDRSYSVLGIRIGGDELEAKNILLDNGYRMQGGAVNTCTAVRGDVTIILGFDHGSVAGIGAYLTPTQIFSR